MVVNNIMVMAKKGLCAEDNFCFGALQFTVLCNVRAYPVDEIFSNLKLCINGAPSCYLLWEVEGPFSIYYAR